MKTITESQTACQTIKALFNITESQTLSNKKVLQKKIFL